MSTRSYIGIEENGKVRGIYCHFDGYIEGVGDILFNHYKNAEKIRELIALGDISSLDAEVEPPQGVEHSWEKPFPGITVAYGRDRGETDVDTREFKDADEFVRVGNDAWAKYFYLFRDGAWYVMEVAGNKFVPLADMLAAVENRG